MHRKAFTFVEVTIAVAIISIVSSLVVINVTNSRKSARNTIRKADISAILASVTQYSLANGSTFISYPDSTKKPGACTVASTTNPSEPADNTTYCVGASGRSYGLVNVAANSGTTLNLDGVGVANATTRTYTQHSIIEALKAGGYLNIDAKDPLNRTGKIGNTDAGVTADYALIRACPNGRQHVAKRGQLFAVWTVLESTLSTSDLENLNRVVGYKDATPDAGGYDFAAGAALQAKFESNGFGVSNGASRPQDTSSTGSCSAPAA
jgi:prepilin-type N-terminal cleavage/methylation domain-containing protein